MILLDTGPIVSFFDASDLYHHRCIEVLKNTDEDLLTTWPVLTEAFYLLNFSLKAQDNLWEFIIRGGIQIQILNLKMQIRCRALMEKYKDLPMDLADGTLVATAEENGLNKVFTLDHKDFRIYRISRNKKFKLIPEQI